MIMIQRNHVLCFSKLRNSILFVLYAITVSCNSTSKKVEIYKKLDAVISDSLKIQKHYNKIIILSESGCIGCNKRYSTFVSSNLHNSEILFIVTASGNNLDISSLMENKATNLVFDYKNNLAKTNIFDGSGAIFTSNNTIDTIILIDAKDFDAQLNYIQKRINN
jgi:hypothetical protein